MATDAAALGTSRRDTAFFGHPVGLGWLAFSELWERFSYYGMLALLPLYLVHSLLLPGHVEHIVGFGALKAFVALFYGSADSAMALKAHITGLYAAFVYLTPLAGGFLADRYLGRTTAVTIGALLMALGHFLMAFEASFVGAIVCLMTGVGFFKGNISSQVGSLYKTDDPRRANAFQIFLLAVQIAVIGSPLVCSTLGELYGWDLGFGAAGVGMLIGLGVYLTGRRHMPPEVPRMHGVEQNPPLTRQDGLKIAVLVLLLPALAIGVVGNQQISNAYPNWAEANLNLVFFGEKMPTGWLQSVDAIVSTITMLLVIAFWRWWEKRWTEPDELAKITLGIAISAMAPLALAMASAVVAQTHGKTGVFWVFVFEIFNDIGFANVLPVGLALYTRAAPKSVLGLVVGIYYLHLFAGNYFTGWVAGLYGEMPDVSFWLLHVGFMAVAAVVLLLARFAFGRTLAPAYKELAPA
ncbi:MAG TPA: MFS transporter [Rhizomicrobium sp.]|nr:MFS transporter [Rhizomicrobium sp.]